MNFTVSFISVLLQAWAQAFVSQLERGSQPPSALSTPAAPLPTEHVSVSYAASSRRLIVLGVGGTLLPCGIDEAEAEMDPEVRR